MPLEREQSGQLEASSPSGLTPFRDDRPTLITTGQLRTPMLREHIRGSLQTHEARSEVYSASNDAAIAKWARTLS